MGGGIALRTVTRAALPPVTRAPIHIMLGDDDRDTDLADCQALARQIGAGISVYHGATQQRDAQRDQGFMFHDPLANRGSGGTVIITPSPALAEQSRRLAQITFVTPLACRGRRPGAAACDGRAGNARGYVCVRRSSARADRTRQARRCLPMKCNEFLLFRRGFAGARPTPSQTR